MGRILLATLLGAVVLFAWGMAAWMVLGLHDSSIHKIPDESAVATHLQQQGLRTGVYIYPGMPTRADAQAPGFDREKAEAEFMQRHEQGPIFTVFFKSEGQKVMGPNTMAGGWAINLITVFIAASLLSAASRGGMTYIQRVGIVMMMGIFAALLGHGSLYVWMLFPLDWTLAMMVDMALGWTLVGLVLAAFIRPQATTTHTTMPAPGAGS